MDPAGWNRGLLLASLLIAIAGMTLVAAETRRQRLLAVGMALQAIMLALVFNSAFYQRSELSSVAVALVVVFGLWCLMSGEARDEDDSSTPHPSTAAGHGESKDSQDGSAADVEGQP